MELLEARVHPKEVVRFFITEIQDMAAQLDVDSMPYDFQRLSSVRDAMAGLLRFGTAPRHFAQTGK